MKIDCTVHTCDGEKCFVCWQTALIEAQTAVISGLREKLRRQSRRLLQAQTEAQNWRREYTLLKGEPWDA